ncbi:MULTISPECIES: ABC transporter permease/substrate binding protein [unclassified Thermoactinomyces]|uniref:ABC transporter permease/substrate binding protein n=1 Tax=unclassified Thermoactinomyces TaxID=2634588 RepID=UPI0007A0E143|nr:MULTISPECIES: ABC transporter permease/substrate binding protein [unclassified Thermoactinomyces]KYQ85615.1 glycine/betaine ABC transporter permease [Thermoactinomyces sp. AS95]MBI0388228.1 ABC transporter permease/substrate binding protein [Thermoactinomyces sp. CICC 24227]
MNLPKLPLADWVDALIKWMQEYFAPLFHFIQGIITPITDFFERVLSVTPPLVTILLLTLLVWLLSRLRIAVFALVGFLLIYDLGLWEISVETLALVLTSTLISIIIGIPLGLWAGRSDRVKQIVTPVLDFMQTMPAFVYLIPAVFFFALGAVPAVIASVVFAMPPTIRMTSLGLRQVSKELKEAANAFGSTSWQRLVKVEIPLAKPTILAGINQTIMLSLSMVVISSMIGAGGLGEIVLESISRLQVGLGFEAGLAIVIIAIVLDRMTQNLGKTKTAPSGGNGKKKFPVRKWMSVVAILVFLGMVIAAYADFGGGKEKVTLAYVSWESEIASTNVVKKVLEKQGFEVDLVETQATPMWQGVAQGDVDAHVAGWFPVTSKVIADQFKGQYVDLGPNLEGARVGLVVPSYVKANSITELNQYKDQFKGRIVGIDPGASMMQTTEKVIDEYGLDFQLINGSDATMSAELSKAIQKKEWIVVTGWQPHWKFADFDLKFLEDPKKMFGGEEAIHTIVRKGLKEDKPEVYRILDRFHWTKEDMEEVMSDIHNGMSPDKAAEKWVENHPDKVKEWTQGE